MRLPGQHRPAFTDHCQAKLYRGNLAMKALLMRGYGSNDRVAYADVPNPHMGPEDVLIDVHAAGINPIDYKTVRGMLKPLVRLRLPVVLGNECAGVVAAVGSGVVGVAPGDAVFTRVAKERLGTFAQQVAVDHRLVAPKPANCSFEEAASLPLVGLTCWQALVELAQLKPREQVLIHGGSGGVGTFAIQLAHYLGARIATTAGGDAGGVAAGAGRGDGDRLPPAGFLPTAVGCGCRVRHGGRRNPAEILRRHEAGRTHGQHCRSARPPNGPGTGHQPVVAIGAGPDEPQERPGGRQAPAWSTAICSCARTAASCGKSPGWWKEGRSGLTWIVCSHCPTPSAPWTTWSTNTREGKWCWRMV